MFGLIDVAQNEIPDVKVQLRSPLLPHRCVPHKLTRDLSDVAGFCSMLNTLTGPPECFLVVHYQLVLAQVDKVPQVWLFPKGKKGPPFPIDLTTQAADVRDLVKMVRTPSSLPPSSFSLPSLSSFLCPPHPHGLALHQITP